MKKKLTKSICLMATAAMLAVSVTACGGDKTESSAESTTVAESTTEKELAVEETTETTSAPETTETSETVAEAAEGELTEEEYLTKVEEIGQAMTDVSAKAQQLDSNDLEGAKKALVEMEGPFKEFAALTAPEKYAEAQAKYKSGCEAMIEYLEICVEMVGMENPTEEETKDLTDRLTAALTTVGTDFAEGSDLMMKAAGEVAETSAAQ